MKATLSWQNPFAWQIITFISSCKLYSLSFLMKLGYFCDSFQSLQRQSAGFLPPDPPHPGDIPTSYSRGCLPSAADGLCLLASHLALTAWKSNFGVPSLGGHREGWGKRKKRLFLSLGRQKDADRIHGLPSSGLSLLLELAIPPLAWGGMCSLSQTWEEGLGGQQLARAASMAGDSCVGCFVADTASGQCWLDWLGAGSCEPKLLKCTAEKTLSTWDLQDTAFSSVAGQHLAQGAAG